MSGTVMQFSSTLAHVRDSANSWLNFAGYPSEFSSSFRTVYFLSNITLGFLSSITYRFPSFVAS